MTVILWMLVLVFAVYFAIRFYLLKKALKETSKQLQMIQKDLKKNQVLHLPLPDHDLENLMSSINCVLDAVREERKDYAKRESEFQSEIEAISHDLRTPLTVILGYLGFLQKQRLSLTTDQREMLDIMERKTRSMETLISQFYDYSRLNANDYEIKIEEIDVGRVLREVFTENCMILERATLNVQTDFPNHPIWIEGETTALKRIFSNLFQNAGRYANCFLHISIQEKGTSVQVIFENDMQKANADTIPYLFDRFYMADPSRNKGGTGLGLTIAKCLAEKMAGSLTADFIHIKEQGTPSLRFTLCLKGTNKNENVTPAVSGAYGDIGTSPTR